jgi:hypothetical protein
VVLAGFLILAFVVLAVSAGVFTPDRDADDALDSAPGVGWFEPLDGYGPVNARLTPGRYDCLDSTRGDHPAFGFGDDAPAMAEALLVAQLLGGELDADGYRRAMAELAAQDAAFRPVFVPPERPHGPRG